MEGRREAPNEQMGSTVVDTGQSNQPPPAHPSPLLLIPTPRRDRRGLVPPLVYRRVNRDLGRQNHLLQGSQPAHHAQLGWGPVSPGSPQLELRIES